MTRIMLRLILLLVGEGLILLCSGETTVSSIQDHTDHPQFTSEIEHISLPDIAGPSNEGDLQKENSTADFNHNDSSMDANQQVNQFSKESETHKSVEKPTESGNEGKDPNSDFKISEMDATTMTFSLDLHNSTAGKEEVVRLELSSVLPNEFTTQGSISTSKNSVYTSEKSAESTSSNLLSSTSESIEETTIADVVQPLATQGSNSELSSVVEESSSSSEESSSLSEESSSLSEESSSSNEESSSSSEESSSKSYESTEIAVNSSHNLVLIDHQPYNPEKEEMTTSKANIEDFERESEFEMAGSEADVKVVPSQIQTVIIKPSVVVVNEEHDVVDKAGLVISKEGEQNAGHSKDHNLGITFDPDGMTHDGPQDPDSVIFFVPGDFREIESSKENFEISSNESENVNSMKEIQTNGRKKFEKLEHIETETIVSEREVMELPSSSSPIPDSSEMGLTLPEFQIHKNSQDDESEEMLQDAPHGINILPDFGQNIPGEAVLVKDQEDSIPKSETPITLTTNEPKVISTKDLGLESSDLIEKTSTKNEPKIDVPKGLEKETSVSIKKTITTEDPQTENLKISIEDSVGTSSQVPDQSIIRPVKVSSPSPVSDLVSTQQSASSSISSDPTSIPVNKVIESSSEKSSSPILPEPVHKQAGNVPVSTLTPSPELVASTMDSNSTTIEIKSLVSTVISASEPPIQSLQSIPSTNSNSSLSSVTLATGEKETNESSFTQTSLTQSTTEAPSTGFKIRKPKLKIGGSTDDRPSRAPYVPKRPGFAATTEAGPPVSIFKKQRTRIASITSSTTAKSYSYRPYSTIRVHYATHAGGFPILPELVISTEPVTTTTEPTTTTTEDPIEEVPFTAQTVRPVVSDKEETTLVKVAAYIALDRGIRWHPLLDNRQTPEYKENEERVLMHLERLFRSSSIADRLWKIEIDGFSGNLSSRPVGVDFFLYLIKSTPISAEELESVFKSQLTDRQTFGTFRVDVGQTAFELLQEEPLVKPTPPPGDEDEGVEPPIPQWAIACIVIGAASLIFIVLFAAVTLYGRHAMRRRYSSSKLNSEGEEGDKGDWESKMAAAYENMAADTLYDADDNTYKKHSSSRLATFHGLPSPLKRSESWNSTRVAPRWTQHFD